MYFIVLTTLLGIAAGASAVLTWTALLLLGWNLYRARPQLSELLRRSVRLDRRDS
jgi:hypothetical protein